HGTGTLANEPTVGDNHWRVDKSGHERKTDHAQVNNHEARIAIHPGQQDVTNAGKKNRRYEGRPRTVAIDEIADERRLYCALSAGERKRECRRRPANS